MMEYNHYSTDVLVIGIGGAGTRAAIEAADQGVAVILAGKKKIGISGATSYPVAEMAGYNAGDIAKPEEIESHYQDIISAGQGMAIEKLARIVAENAPFTINQLEDWGVTFEHEGEGYYIFKSCFSNEPRTHVIRGHGEPILKAAKKQIELRKNIKVLEDFSVVGLLVSKGQCYGAYGLLGTELIIISAKAVVLATGGCGSAFEKNMNPDDVTGAGYALAYYAGADLINMEFMQIGIGYSWPVVNIFNGYLWETKPKLEDGNGSTIFSDLPDGLTPDIVMHEHRKHFPFSTSDDAKFLEIAIHSAIQNGRAAEHGGIQIDFSGITDEYVNSLNDDCGIHHMWPVAKNYLMSKGVDLSKDKPEISCFAHAINGGILINENAESTISCLFAAGECAGGPHGADRLGGNMMVTCQVFGAIAGRNAGEKAKKIPQHIFDQEEFKDIEQNKLILLKDIDATSILKELKRLTQQNLLINRFEEGLLDICRFTEDKISEIDNAKCGDVYHPENLDLFHMLTTIRIMAGSAERRKESRGSHHRKDYPEKSVAYNKPIVVNRKSINSSKL